MIGAPDRGRVSVDILDVSAAADLEGEWRALAARSAASIFLSWEWIGAWLESHAAVRMATLARVHLDGRIIGLGILCPRNRKRGPFVWSRGLYLHATGDETLDELTVEYNGFLAESGREQVVAFAVLEKLLESDTWDELYLDGWLDVAGARALETRGVKVVERRSRPFPYVDLRALRSGGGTFIDTLPRSPRQHLRRSIREVEARGPMAFTAASSAGEARQYLDGLVELHQASWAARGRPGSFSNSYFKHFHERFVYEKYDEGLVQMLRLSTGGRGVGYLYNFAHRGRIYAYQSGFDFQGANSAWRPGLVCHALAIEHNRAAGHDIYDFMAGEQQHKGELASAEGRMSWLTLERPRRRFELERALRRMRDRYEARGRRRYAKTDGAASMARKDGPST